MCLRTVQVDAVKASTGQDISGYSLSPGVVGAGMMLFGFSSLWNKSQSNSHNAPEMSVRNTKRTTGHHGKAGRRIKLAFELAEPFPTTLNGHARWPSLLQAFVLFALFFLALVVLSYHLTVASYKYMSWPQISLRTPLGRFHVWILSREHRIGIIMV